VLLSPGWSTFYPLLHIFVGFHRVRSLKLLQGSYAGKSGSTVSKPLLRGSIGRQGPSAPTSSCEPLPPEVEAAALRRELLKVRREAKAASAAADRNREALAEHKARASERFAEAKAGHAETLAALKTNLRASHKAELDACKQRAGIREAALAAKLAAAMTDAAGERRRARFLAAALDRDLAVAAAEFTSSQVAHSRTLHRAVELNDYVRRQNVWLRARLNRLESPSTIAAAAAAELDLVETPGRLSDRPRALSGGASSSSSSSPSSSSALALAAATSTPMVRVLGSVGPLEVCPICCDFLPGPPGDKLVIHQSQSAGMEDEGKLEQYGASKLRKIGAATHSRAGGGVGQSPRPKKVKRTSQEVKPSAEKCSSKFPGVQLDGEKESSGNYATKYTGVRRKSEEYSGGTTTLSCGHRFCAPCLQSLAASEVADGLGRPTRQSIALTCPLCRSRVREAL